MKKIKSDFELLMPRRAGFWRRAAAFIIDLIIIYAVTSPLTGLLAKGIGLQDEFSISTFKEIFSRQELFYGAETMVILVAAVMALAGLFYWSILEYSLKQSIGKMIMKIAVKSQLKELSIWQVIARNITKALAVTSLSIIFLIDLLYLLFNKNRQRLSEVLSKTEVCNADE